MSHYGKRTYYTEYWRLSGGLVTVGNEGVYNVNFSRQTHTLREHPLIQCESSLHDSTGL